MFPPLHSSGTLFHRSSVHPALRSSVLSFFSCIVSSSISSSAALSLNVSVPRSIVFNVSSSIRSSTYSRLQTPDSILSFYCSSISPFFISCPIDFPFLHFSVSPCFRLSVPSSVRHVTFLSFQHNER